MHVMAINGSPRKEKSSTYHILSPLLEGMRAAGATTELVNLGHLRIRSCLGCFLCWVKTSGKCVQEDDMAAVLERFVQADLLVFGTPLYHYNVSGLMKNFIDRTLPSFEPWLVEDPRSSGQKRPPGSLSKGQEHVAGLPLRLARIRAFYAARAIFPVFGPEAGLGLSGGNLAASG